MESRLVQWGLIATALLFLLLFLLVPLASVFAQAFERGAAAYLTALRDPQALAAAKLSLLIAAVVVPLNTLFGLTAAWAIGRFQFPGKSILTALVDLPLAVSPVVVGLIFVLLFGQRGWFGPWLAAHDIKIIFAVPGIVIATLFVTFPFVAREIIPLLQTQGDEEETAALVLGASGWQAFRRITLPNIKWALLYGIVLTNARALGEFGAVSVVSGRIRGLTNTIPLHVEILYNEYNFVGAFAVASVLVLVALPTIFVRSILERKTREGQQESPGGTPA